MTAPSILVEERAGYRVITLNRPDKLNAFNEAMHEALRDAIDEAEADESCRALHDHRRRPRLLRRAGPLRPPAQAGRDAGARRQSLERYYNPLVRKLRALPFPVVAAVNGVAAGAGCNIALACDIVLAARSANFVQSFARIGLVPDSGGTWLLPRLVGDARARGLALLGRAAARRKGERMGPDLEARSTTQC